MIDYYVASIEFLGLVFYEFVLASIMGTFNNAVPIRKKVYLLLSLAPLMIMTMFRSDLIGNDTREYLRFFDIVKDLSLKQAIEGTRFENGYVLFNHALSMISHNNRILLVAYGTLIYYSLAKWLNKRCVAPGLLICLLVEMLYFDNWMSVIRQSLALFVILFSFEYIVQEKLLKYAFFTLIACQFHNAAYSFFLAWPVMRWYRNKNNSNFNSLRETVNKVLTVFVACCIITMFLKIIMSTFFAIFPAYSYYLNSNYMDGNMRLAVNLKILVFLLMMLFPLLFKRKEISDDKTGYRCLLTELSLINLFFLILANNATILARFTDIFSFFAVVSYVENINDIINKKNKIIMILVTIAAFAIYGLTITILKTPEWQTTYPFDWCF